jgi:hypothetical protein
MVKLDTLNNVVSENVVSEQKEFIVKTVKAGLMSAAVVLLLAACNREPIQATLTPQDFGSSGADFASDVAAPRGGVGAVVVGGTNGSLESPNQGDYDAFIRNYDGAPVWASQYGTSTLDYATDVAMTSTGVSYTLGITSGILGLKVGGEDVFLRKYDASGVVQWTRQFGTTGNDQTRDVTLDSSGNVYVLTDDDGTTTNVKIRKYSSSGTLLLTITNNASINPAALGVDSAGNIYLFARLVTSSSFARIYKYSSAGTLLTVANAFSSSTGLYLCDLIIDSSDNVYVSLYDFGANKGGYAIKLTSSLTRAWLKRLEPASTGATSTPQSLALDTSDNLYIGGYTTGSYTGFTNAGGYDTFALKYSPSGTRLWRQQFGAAGDDLFQGIAVSDAVYVAGHSNSNPNLLGDPGYGDDDAFLAQLDPATGAVFGIDQ